MARVLAASLWEMGPDATPVFFPAGTSEDALPEWAAQRLEGSPAWFDQAGDIPVPRIPPDAPAGPPEPQAPPAVVGRVPPRHGRGSSLAHWAEFADANGVNIGEGMSRDDVIAACEDAGLLAAD